MYLKQTQAQAWRNCRCQHNGAERRRGPLPSPLPVVSPLSRIAVIHQLLRLTDGYSPVSATLRATSFACVRSLFSRRASLATYATSVTALWPCKAIAWVRPNLQRKPPRPSCRSTWTNMTTPTRSNQSFSMQTHQHRSLRPLDRCAKWRASAIHTDYAMWLPLQGQLQLEAYAPTSKLPRTPRALIAAPTITEPPQ